MKKFLVEIVAGVTHTVLADRFEVQQLGSSPESGAAFYDEEGTLVAVYAFSRILYVLDPEHLSVG